MSRRMVPNSCRISPEVETTDRCLSSSSYVHWAELDVDGCSCSNLGLSKREEAVER